jgi:hypothetical protein
MYPFSCAEKMHKWYISSWFYFLSFFLEGLKEVKAILIGFALIEIDFVIFMYFFKYGRYYL